MTPILTHALAIAAGGLFVWLFLTRSIERRVRREFAEEMQIGPNPYSDVPFQ